MMKLMMLSLLLIAAYHLRPASADGQDGTKDKAGPSFCTKSECERDPSCCKECERDPNYCKDDESPPEWVNNYCQSNYRNPWGKCGVSEETGAGPNQTRCDFDEVCVAIYPGSKSGICEKNDKPYKNEIICGAEPRPDSKQFYIFKTDPETCMLSIEFNDPSFKSYRFVNCGRDVKNISGKCGPNNGNLRCDTGEYCSKAGYCGESDEYKNGVCDIETRPSVEKFIFYKYGDETFEGNFLESCPDEWGTLGIRARCC